MTAMTSSGSSLTLKARHLALGASVARRRRISTPPPPGRWTSSRTTSGAASTIVATAPSTSPASPTISTNPSNSLRTPARNSAWSSTSTTVGKGWDSLIDDQLHFGARSGRALDGGAAAVPGHAAHDRLAHAAPVVVDGGRVKAHAAIADEDLGAAVLDLHEQRDRLGAAVTRGVGQGLARCGDQRAVAVVELAVA